MVSHIPYAQSAMKPQFNKTESVCAHLILNMMALPAHVCVPLEYQYTRRAKKSVFGVLLAAHAHSCRDAPSVIHGKIER